MNNIGKKVMAGTIAASLLFGGAALVQTKVLAAEEPAAESTAAETSSVSASNETSNSSFESRGHHRKGKGGGKHIGNLVEETAGLLGVEESSITSQLQQGKSFAEIAAAGGLSKADYLKKLTEIETKAIDDKLSAGQITEAHAEEHKARLADQLTKAIESNKAGHEGRGKGYGFGPFGKSEEVAQLLGITEDELKTALAAGKSVLEIAQSKGLNETQLIEKLKENMTDELKEYVNMKRPAAAVSNTE